MVLRIRTGLREVLLVRRRDVFETLERDLAEQLVADGNPELDDAERQALVEGLVAGTLVAVRLDDRRRPLDAPNVRPLIDPARPLVDDEQRTFLSLELVHEAGLSTAGVELEVSTASGLELHGRLDAGGRWRVDDVPRGSCTVKLYDHPVLQPRKRAAGPRTEPGRDDMVWPAGSHHMLSLRAGAHHRIVVVQPPRLYTLSA